MNLLILKFLKDNFKSLAPLFVALIAALMFFIMKHHIAVLAGQNDDLTKALNRSYATLEALRQDRVKLVSASEAASASSEKVRIVTQTRVQKVLVEAPPKDCEDTRKYLIDALKGDK